MNKQKEVHNWQLVEVVMLENDYHIRVCISSNQNKPEMATPTSEPIQKKYTSIKNFSKWNCFFLPVFPPSTESATPAPLGKAINTPTQSRLTSPRDFISAVGKLVELPHLVSVNVVNNLFKKKKQQRISKSIHMENC